jgi:hemolysin III
MSISHNALGPDGGPIYAETNFSNIIVEPMNALSAIVFIIISTYWLWKIRNEALQFGFIFFSMSLMLIGGIGGTIYHAFRVSKYYLLMDWLPITIIIIFCSVYFLNKIFHKLFLSILVVSISLLIQYYIWDYAGKHDHHLSITLNYLLLGISILLPILIYLFLQNWRNVKLVMLSLLFFSLALFFRLIDAYEILPFGTHFLWHTGGALAAWFIVKYIYLENDKYVKKVNQIKWDIEI